jgi:hypothetical protein
VLDRRVEQSADTYENRLVRTLEMQVDVRLRRPAGALARLNASALLDDVSTLQPELAHARRASTFLEEVELPTFLPTQNRRTWTVGGRSISST